MLDRETAIAGTVLSCASDALGFVLSEEHWPGFWAWIIGSPPDTGMTEDESRRIMGEARALILIELDSLESGA